MKKIFLLLLALAFVVSALLCSCNNETEDSGSTDTNTSTNAITDTGTNTDSGTNTETSTNTDTSTSTSTNTNTNTNTSTSTETNNKDEIEPSYDTKVEHGLVVEDLIFDSENNVFNSENTFGSEGKEVNYIGVTLVNVSTQAHNGTYSITSGGVYNLFGQSVNGQININLSNSVNKDVVLILNNVTMTSNVTKAIIYAEKCDSVKIIIPNGTTSTLTDTAANSDKGVIHVKSCDLTLDGKGTLNLNSYAPKGRGIFNTKNLIIDGGIYNINTSVSHGIQGEQSLTINGGTFNITSAKSGLKSGDFDEDKPEEAVEGKVIINAGSFNINSQTNGISSYGSVEINNGYILINSETDGIDTTKDVIFNGGIVQIEAGNDGVKSDAAVKFMSKSNVKIHAHNDGVDANCAVVNTTGVVYIYNEGAFVEDENGSYIWKNNKYQLVDVEKYPNEKKYSLESCKGIKVKESIEISNGTLGIDTYEDALDSTAVVISGGRTVLKSIDDGIDVKASVELKGGALEIINSNKGIKSPYLTMKEGAIATVLSSSDAVDSANVAISGGKMFLFEKLDIGEEGTLSVTGGTLVVLSTTNSPAKPTNSSSLKMITSTLADSENCVYGKWLQISKGNESIAFRLPKNYSAKMSVTCISSDMTAGEYNIIVGDYQVDEKINMFVYTGGEIDADQTTRITVE